MDAPSSPARKRLAAVFGVACAALLISLVPKHEGTVLHGYKDPIGIVTACTGHTATARLGKTYTPEQCEELLVDDLIAHNADVNRCVKVPLAPHQRAAFVSFAFNVGGAKFCGSTLVKKLNAGDYAGACAELSRWVKAGNRKLPYPGLVKRRRAERQLCEGKPL